MRRSTQENAKKAKDATQFLDSMTASLATFARNSGLWLLEHPNPDIKYVKHA
jgi:hypothetical protein